MSPTSPSGAAALPADPSAGAPGEQPRVVLVTGASSGIGRATAHAYAGRRAHLVLLARRRDVLERVAQECIARGAASCTVEPADVTERAAVEAAVDRTLEEHGRLDVCVHAAAVITFGTFLEVPADVFDRVVEVNVLGTANVARAVLPSMRERDDGVLVVVGSVLGRISVPQLVTYCTGKWAVRGLTRMISQAMADRPGVRVVGVAPGATNTPVYAVAGNYSGTAARPPVPVDQPEKVAAAVLRAADRRRRGEESVGLANALMTLGHELLPPVFDRLVGPLMSRLALAGGPLPPTSGNVVEPAEHDAVRGPWSGGGLLGLDRRRRHPSADGD
ncbi:SDR family NAD(P)-dependent oxidoreductase [Oryzobacter sp. R7]|uniref:SDR family NAD(P)-dependent oxidoreductase n=1 Tax=Oryzobacter faecalis TaxID=3388656 RepID=UPI00398D3419